MVSALPQIGTCPPSDDTQSFKFMWLETEPIWEWVSSTRSQPISMTTNSAPPSLLPAYGCHQGPVPTQGSKVQPHSKPPSYPLLLKSPPRRKLCFCSKDIPRQEMDSRHHECLITLIVQVQFTPHSLSTLWETVIKCEMAPSYYSLAQSSLSAGESAPVRARHP